MVALMTVFTALSYMPAKAATVVPKVQFVGEQKTEFTAGERVTFNLNAANYGGRVQYRVVLWNDSTKSYSDLWNTADKYYTNWMPYGNETLPLGWIINEPGTYRITVYAKRAGLANSKTALKGMNCDSYLNGPAFVVKPAAAPTVDSIAPVADVTVNEGETPVLPTEVTLNLSDKTTKTAKVTWDKVDTTKVGTVAVAGTVEGTDKKASVNVIVKAVDLAVKSVSATNVKEIVVEFNKAVDKTTAENKDAYTLTKGIGTVALDKAELQADGKTVVLTLTGTLVNQATDYKLAVTGVKEAAAAKVISVKDLAFVPVDAALPMVEKVESLGNKAVKITFSEPVLMTSTVPATFKIDDKAVSGLYTISGHSITVQLFTALTAGTHKIVINNYITDVIGYQLVEVTKEFEVVADTVAPTIVEVKNPTLESVTVVFSEDVQETEAKTANNYYWLQNTTKKYASSVEKVDARTYKLYFTSKLPGYATDLYVVNVKDYSGNVIAAGTKVAVTAQLDQTRPEVLTAIFDKATNKKITLTFTKPVAPTTFKSSNVVIKKDGVLKSNGYTAVVNGKVVEISFTTALAAGAYTFEFSGMKDTTLLENTMIPYTTSIEVADTTKPVAGAKLIGTLPTFIITFDKEMDTTTAYSVLNPDNYYVTYNTATTTGIIGKLPVGTNITPTNDSMGVIITFPSGVTAVTKLVVQGVKDSVGNILDGYAKEYTLGDFERALKVDAAKATGTKTVLVKMNQPVGNVVADDFRVGAATPTKAEVDSTDNSIVKLTLATALASNVGVTLTTASPLSGNTKGITGADLAAIGSPVAIIDAIAPSVVVNGDGYIEVGAGKGIDLTNSSISAYTLTVNFDENITVKNQAVIGDNFKLYRADGVALVYGLDYTLNAINANNIVFDLHSAAAKLAGQDTDIQVVFDNSNNNIYDSDTYTDFDGTTNCKTYANGFDTNEDILPGAVIHFDCLAPIASVVYNDVNGNHAYDANDTIVITFNEAVTGLVVGDLSLNKGTANNTPALDDSTFTADGTNKVWTLVLKNTNSLLNLEAGNTITIAKAKIVDAQGNIAPADLVLTLPVK